jgi:hypothetical protein
MVVLAPGGGWIANEARRDPPVEGTLRVWLRVAPEEVLRRSASDPGTRPLLAGPDRWAPPAASWPSESPTTLPPSWPWTPKASPPTRSRTEVERALCTRLGAPV